MRVRIVDVSDNSLRMVRKRRAQFVGLLAEFFPMYTSEWGSWNSGTVFLLEGPLVGNTGYYFDEILVSPMTLDNVLGANEK